MTIFPYLLGVLMSVLQDLSEEECYLFALFQDYSGIDIVEFCLVDEEFEGGFSLKYAKELAEKEANDF